MLVFLTQTHPGDFSVQPNLRTNDTEHRYMLYINLRTLNYEKMTLRCSCTVMNSGDGILKRTLSATLSQPTTH